VSAAPDPPRGRAGEPREQGLELDVIGLGRLDPQAGITRDWLARACRLALASAGLSGGHLAISFVGRERIRALNREHRGKDQPTDVLSFGIDEDGEVAGPRELGDVVICPQETADVREAVVHGVLHLTGMDHESDEGEMLALQAELLEWLS